MMDLMNELRQRAAFQISAAGGLPPMRFFTPTARFYKALGELKLDGTLLIDTGAGCGNTADEMHARGFRTAAVDIVRRMKQSPRVHITNAVTFPWTSSTWPVICRPDHSGWAYEVIQKARTRGACAMYVGLDRNVDVDLYDLVGTETKIWKGVGKEGESMWLFGNGLNTKPTRRKRA